MLFVKYLVDLKKKLVYILLYFMLSMYMIVIFLFGNNFRF